MPKYIANAYLLHKGQIVKKGEEVELTKKQAERLSRKVTEVHVEPAPEEEQKEEEVKPKKETTVKKESK